MKNNNQSGNSINNLQKKIVELTQQYYKAIRDNITFENLKAIFIKRKILEKKLSELQNGEENTFDLKVNDDNTNQPVKVGNEYSV